MIRLLERGKQPGKAPHQTRLTEIWSKRSFWLMCCYKAVSLLHAHVYLGPHHQPPLHQRPQQGDLVSRNWESGLQILQQMRERAPWRTGQSTVAQGHACKCAGERAPPSVPTPVWARVGLWRTHPSLAVQKISQGVWKFMYIKLMYV